MSSIRPGLALAGAAAAACTSLGALLLSGCAGQEVQPNPEAPHGPIIGSEDREGSPGAISGRPRGEQVVLGYFEGFGNPATGEFTIRPIAAPSGAERTEDGVRVATRGLCDETDYIVVQDGAPGSGPPDSIEVATVTGTLLQDASCHAPWNPLFDPPLFCADVTVRSFYTSMDLEGVHAEILTMSDTNHLGWPTLMAAEPDPGNPPTAAWGLWSYGTIADVSAAPANAVTRTWVFERNNDTFYSFSGRIVGAAVDGCDGVDNDCDGAVDEDCAVPIATLANIRDVTSSSADMDVTVDDVGGPMITAHGVCWATTPSVMLGGPGVVCEDLGAAGPGLTSFEIRLSQFDRNTSPFLRAFATNVNGTGYSWEWSLTTSEYPVLVDDISSDNAVEDIVIRDGTAYLAGSFSALGTPHGASAVTDTLVGLIEPTSDGANDTVLASTSDGAGGWYIGGAFTQVGGVPSRGVAHILSDGSADPSFMADVDGAVYALALDPAGYVYIGGTFGLVDGIARSRLAAIDALDGSLELGFAVSVTAGWIRALHIEGGNLWVGGDLTSIGGFARQKLAALSLAGWTVQAPAPNINNTVFGIDDDGAGNIYFVGQFTSVNATSRGRGAEIDASGALLAWDPQANGSVNDVEFRGSEVWLGGGFTTIAGAPFTYVAATDPVVGLASGISISLDGTVADLSFTGSGDLLLAGDFVHAGVSERPGAAMVDPLTGAASSWNPGPGGGGRTVLINDTGTAILIGQSGTIFYAVPRSTFASVHLTSGTVNAFPGVGANNSPYALSVSDDGTLLYAAGLFSTIEGSSRDNLAEFSIGSGSITGMNPGFSSGSPWALLAHNGFVYLGGTFADVGGSPRSGLARVLSGGVMTAWDPGPDGTVDSFAAGLGPDVYVTGWFTSIAATSRSGIAQFDGAGSLTGWQPMPDAHVWTVVPAAEGVFVGGDFQDVSGTPRDFVALLDSVTGVPVPSWDAGALDGSVRAIALTTDFVFIGGSFTTAGGQPRDYFATLDRATGALVPWDPGFDSDVVAIATDGRNLLVGGYFYNVGGSPRFGLAAFR